MLQEDGFMPFTGYTRLPEFLMPLSCHREEKFVIFGFN